MASTFLSPVILPIPRGTGELSGKEKVDAKRRVSREALRVCAYVGGMKLGNLKKDKNGAPLPFNGVYWSVSHKDLFVAAVLGAYPMGIDVEKIVPRSERVITKVVSPDEFKFCLEDELRYFFRVWTAKEAVLKVEGIGLQGLKHCCVVGRPAENTISVKYKQTEYWVEQLLFCEHIVSLVTRGEAVRWILPSDADCLEDIR